MLLSLVATLRNSIAGKSFSIAKLCVRLAVGFLTWPFNIQFPHQIFFSFEGMTLYFRLEDGLLFPGLSLFGDNSYLNTPYMATPYSAVQVVQWIHITLPFAGQNPNLVYIWDSNASLRHL